MKINNILFLSLIVFFMACGPKPQKGSSRTKEDKEPQEATETQFDQVIIASSSEEQKGQPLVATILNRVVGGAEGAYIGYKMDQLANQLEKKFPKANVSRIGEGILMKLNKQSDFYFENEATDLSDQQKDQLKKLSQILSIYKQTKIHLVNHTDALGSAEKNQQVARKRVEQVAIQLKENRLNADRLILDWHGHSHPSDNKNADQRLEIGIIAGKQMLSMARESVSDK
jgi:outer membrane protein OmpA-like peptidoglycan-associated protein